MIELRPCPFCGGRAELNEHTGYGWRTVQCVECCASTSESGVYTAAEAAARWNRRAADQPNSTCERGEARSPACPLPESGCDDSGSAAGPMPQPPTARECLAIINCSVHGRQIDYFLCPKCAADQPAAAREHTTSEDCWCNPTLDYVDPDTGAAVYVHHELS